LSSFEFSSFILPRKFYFCSPLNSGGITLYPDFDLGYAEDIVQALYSMRGTNVNATTGTDKQSATKPSEGSRSANSVPSKDGANASSSKVSKEAGEFITDIEPFLFDRAITYVDVGANVGNVMKSLLDSHIWVHKAHLVEPNPKIFASLEQSAEKFSANKRLKQLSCHNLAMGDTPGKLTMRDEGTMTHVVQLGTRSDSTLPDGLFEIDSVTLDTLAEQNEIRHIDLLKVDVEGHEVAVFDGARRLLAAQAIDVVYVEAGLDPESSQQTYYRTIEDKLNEHGYRLFRIYEQNNEWIDDNPFLRRANLAFMSARFAASNPYKVSRKLFDARRNEQALAAEAAELRKQTKELSDRLKERDRELHETSEKLSEAAAKRKEHWQKVQSLTETAAATKVEHAAQVASRDETIANLTKQSEAREAALTAAETQAKQLQKELAFLTEKLNENADFQAKHVAQLSSRDAKIADLTQKSEAREAALTAAETQAKQLQKELAFLTEKLEANSGRSNREIEKLKNSTSWRITAPMRLLKETMTTSKKNKRR
jgi:FkbM family methyltransferase